MTSRPRLVIATVLGFATVMAVGSFRVGHGQTQTLPAPVVDRIGFPSDYRTTFQPFYTFDNFQNRQIRVVFGNATAASVTPGQTFNFPYGSVILFESWSVKEDPNGEPLRDNNGRFMKNVLTTLFVMRKERGFGADYKELRNGEWEYVAYKPDGSYATPPSGTGSCALCHLTGAGLPLTPQSQPIGAQWDYVFRPELYLAHGNGAVPDGVMANYVFVPSIVHARPGQTVTVYNSDQLLHHIVADDGSFDTGVMVPGSTFSVTMSRGSSVSYHCTIHSRMKGQIVVEGPAVGGTPIPSVVKPILPPKG